MNWQLSNKNGDLVQPLSFSNGKTQKDIVGEIMDNFSNGSDIIFFGANVGSGKSAIALNLIDQYGKKGIIACPTKVLQDQYENSYTKKLHIGNLNIKVIKGRSNFLCHFANCKASNSHLPCIRRLKNNETRWKVASKCPNWNPVLPTYIYEKIKKGLLFEEETYDYEAVDGKYTYVKRGDGCDYYNQYESYLDDAAIIMNSQKWIIETLYGRKPKVEIEIIDEADLFLDNLSFNCQVTHGILDYIELAEKRKFKKIKELHGMLNEKDLDWYRFLKIFENILMSCISEYAQSYLFKISLMRKCGEDINVDYSLVDQVVNFSITKPDKIFNILKEKSASKLLLMSATPQEKSVFESIFKIPVNMIQGETQFPGILKIIETGKELNINHYNWQNLNFREEYWEILNYMINIAEKPLLVNVFSYKYLPDYKKDNIPSVNDIKKSQDKNIKDFLTGKIDVLFSTKFDRGISLDNSLCRSIIMTKLPIPDLLDNELVLLKKYYGDFIYTRYINDMILREVLQNTGRILRNRNDYASFYTVDRQLLKIIPYIWKGEKIINLSNKKKK
jgi:hypothetical protein